MLSASQYTSLQALVNCPGPSGPAGPRGATGSGGGTGPRGATGTNGINGATGDPGPGSEISPTFAVRGLTSPQWFEWSISGTNNWSSADVGIVYGSTGQALDTNTEIRAITFNGTVWVCSVFVKTASATVYPQFLYSSTGKIWTASTSFPFGQANEVRGAYDIGWNGRTFVATGTSGNVSVVYSTDNGITWTAVDNSASDIIEYGRAVAWNGKAWLLTGKPALGSALIAYSLNGVSWTPVTTAAAQFAEGYSLASDGKLWVVGGSKEENNDIPIWSESLTGDTGWQTVSGWASVGFAQDNYVSDISWNGRQWIALVYTDADSVQSVLVSTNGKAWVHKQTGLQLKKAISVTWNSYSWIVTGESTTPNQILKYSTDNGETWIPISTDKAATSITSRTISGSFYEVVPYINVRDFGAIGDGIIDDTVSINSAISYAEKYKNGARVIVPAGIYKYDPLADGIPNRIEFVQETGATFISKNTGLPLVLTSDQTSNRSRIVKNDDETNGLSSYNGVVMNGVYGSGGGLGDDSTRSVANMFDIRTDRRQIGIPINIKIANTIVTTNTFRITTIANTLPPVKVGNVIIFNTSMPVGSDPFEIVSGNSYYIQSANATGNIMVIKLATNQSLTSILTVTDVSADVTGTVYDSTDVFGSTLTGRTILNVPNVSVGGRIGVEGRVEQTASTSISNLNKNYIGVSGISSTSSGDGGTDLVSNAIGKYVGGKLGASLTGTAANVERVTGAQFDVSMTGATSSSKYIFGASSVSSFAETLNPATKAAAYQIGAASGSGWLHGILFSNLDGANPLGATGTTVLGTHWTDNSTRTIGNGIDLSGFEMRENVLASPRLRIKDISGASPIVTTVTNAPLTLEANGTGVATLKSGSGTVKLAIGSSDKVIVASGGTTFTENLYARYIAPSSSDTDALLQLRSLGTGNVEISSTGTGKVSLLSDTTISTGRSLAFASGSTGTFTTGTGHVTLNGSTTLATGRSLTFADGSTGTFSTGTGDVSLRGNVTIADNKTFTQGGTGTFSTGTGDVSLRGNVVIADGKTFTQGGTGTFSTGTGDVALNGNVVIASGRSFTFASGSTGTFSTGTGDVILNGSTTLATGRSLTFASGSTGTFSTGTGDVILNGSTTLATGRSLTFASGSTGTFSTGTGDVILNGSTTLSTGRSLTFASGSTGTFSTGTGLVQLNGNTELAESKILTIKTSAGGHANAEISSHSLLLARDAGGNANIGISSGTDYDNVSLQITPKGIASIYLNGITEITEDNRFTQNGSGTFSTGSGNVFLNGTTEIAGNKNLNFAGGNGNFNMGSSTGTFSTGTGDVTLNGSTTLATGRSLAFASGSTGTFTTGTGHVTLNGSTTLATGRSLAFASGSTGTFSTGTGDVSLRGNVIIADNKTFTQGGTGTFSTGTGDVTLNGSTTLATGRSLAFASGSTGTFSTGTGAVQLNGDTTITGSKTFTTGTGDVELRGSTTLTTGRSLTFASGSTGTFSTGTGAVALNGDVAIASTKSLGFKGTVSTVTQAAGSTGAGRVEPVSQNGTFGQIITSTNSLSQLSAGAASATQFTLTNTSIGSNDMILISHSETNVYYVNAYVTADSTARISIRNLTTQPQTAAITIRYFVLKFSV